MSRQKRVFISGTTQGFGEWRKHIAVILRAHGIMPVEQEAARPKCARLLKTIKDEIFDADGVICLVGPFYGEPSPEQTDGFEMSYTQYEWSRAHELKRPCLTFIAERSFFGEMDIENAETPDARACQAEFKDYIVKYEKRVGARGGYRCVATPLGLALELCKVNWEDWLRE